MLLRVSCFLGLAALIVASPMPNAPEGAKSVALPERSLETRTDLVKKANTSTIAEPSPYVQEALAKIAKALPVLKSKTGAIAEPSEAMKGVLAKVAQAISANSKRSPESETFLEKRNWLDDVLKVVQTLDPIVVPLISARSIDGVGYLGKRDWLEDIIKVVGSLEPVVLPLIAAAR